MSSQLSFYAIDSDVERISEIVLDVLPDVVVLPARGHGTVVRPVPAEPGEELRQASLQVPRILTNSVRVSRLAVRRLSAEDWRIDLRGCPVLEFCRFFGEAPDTAGESRFAYFYTQDDAFGRLVKRLYRKLRSESRAIPGLGATRIFPGAERAARFLRPAVGPARPNPLRVEG